MAEPSSAGAAPRFIPTRIFLGLLGAYLTPLAFVALARSLGGGPVAPEIGSRLVDGGLLLMTFVAGTLIAVTAVLAGRAPALARNAGLAGGVLLVVQAVVTASFVLAWEPPPSPSMAGMRLGELIGNALWLAIGAAVLVLSARVRPRPTAPGGSGDGSLAGA